MARLVFVVKSLYPLPDKGFAQSQYKTGPIALPLVPVEK
jgi:hypothetical protein